MVSLFNNNAPYVPLVSFPIAFGVVFQSDFHSKLFFFAFQVFISLESTPDSMFRTDAVKYALIGLMRDLRGVAMATNRHVI